MLQVDNLVNKQQIGSIQDKVRVQEMMKRCKNTLNKSRDDLKGFRQYAVRLVSFDSMIELYLALLRYATGLDLLLYMSATVACPHASSSCHVNHGIHSVVWVTTVVSNCVLKVVNMTVHTNCCWYPSTFLAKAAYLELDMQGCKDSQAHKGRNPLTCCSC